MTLNRLDMVDLIEYLKIYQQGSDDEKAQALAKAVIDSVGDTILFFDKRGWPAKKK